MIPAIVAQAGQLAQSDHQGIVSYRIHRVSAVDGGPIHNHDDVLLAVVADGDRIVKVRVLHYVQNGTEQSDDVKNKLAADLVGDEQTLGFAVPFDSRHFNEYAYDASGATVTFHANQRDANHGDGTFTVDPNGHVTHMVYAPGVLPPHADRGTVSVDRGQVLPGLWASTRADEEYDGSYLFIHGHGSLVTTSDSFTKYPTREAAEAALDALKE